VAPSVAVRFPVTGLVPVTSARHIGDIGHGPVTASPAAALSRPGRGSSARV